MVDFKASESASTTAHLASPCQAAYIGFGSARMANMTSSSANRLLVADTQHQVAASRRLPRAGQRQRLGHPTRYREAASAPAFRAFCQCYELS